MILLQASLGGLGAPPKLAALQTVHLKVHEIYDDKVNSLITSGRMGEWWPGYGVPHAGTLDYHMLGTVVVVSVQ